MKKKQTKFSMKQLETAKNTMIGNVWIGGIYGIGLGNNCVRVYITQENIRELIPQEVQGVPVEVILVPDNLEPSQKLLSS